MGPTETLLYKIADRALALSNMPLEALRKIPGDDFPISDVKRASRANIIGVLLVEEFETEAQEQEFWSAHDSTDYVDWSKAQRLTFGRLKPSTQTISLRLPAALLEDLKLLANKRDVPYQSLLKIFLAERVAQERHSHS